ncbi:MAG TPA: phosphotransferase [Candidatus Saccharimonadales bacterium]|nr:phosphotransferase [Candidatus Saccharimonadales bacterium]
MPRTVKDEVATLLGSPVVRAARVYGGYAPSATFRVALRDGRRVFLKSTYPLPTGSGVHWSVDREERFYRSVGVRVQRWAPRYFGSFQRDGWHVLALEDLGARSVPPWTDRKMRYAARDYARFHASTLGTALPRWLPRREHLKFASFWSRLRARGEIRAVASLARRRTDEAEEWLDVALPLLLDGEQRLARLRGPSALIHGDTRSDNIRIVGERLRIFDWPFACVGPAEFDLAAFAQTVAAEGGPAPEAILAEYTRVLPLRHAAIDASLAGIAGYFADCAWRPPVTGLPRLRPWQRRQLKASLAWAARRFGLPEPGWLAAVAD